MMTRFLTVGAAQMGPIQRSHTRRDVVERLIAHLREAKRMGCELVVFPELTLTTFFPRWWMTDQAEIDSFFEREMPSNETAPLVHRGQAARDGLLPGLCRARQRERQRSGASTPRSWSSATATIVGKYRKVHLPGHAEHEPERPFQHLEKRYFEVGNLGFPVFKAFGGNMGMCICNDRRWPETYRVMGLQNVEMVLLGYNTPLHNAPSPDHDEHSWFHNQLSMQAGAYQNGTWVVGVAKGGSEEGVPSLADSMIVAPSGKVVARAGGEGDELVVLSLRPRRRPELQAHDLQLRGPPPARPVPHDRRAQGRDRSLSKPPSRSAELAEALFRRAAEQRHVGVGGDEGIADLALRPSVTVVRPGRSKRSPLGWKPSDCHTPMPTAVSRSAETMASILSRS